MFVKVIRESSTEKIIFTLEKLNSLFIGILARAFQMLTFPSSAEGVMKISWPYEWNPKHFSEEAQRARFLTQTINFNVIKQRQAQNFCNFSYLITFSPGISLIPSNQSTVSSCKAWKFTEEAQAHRKFLHVSRNIPTIISHSK